MAHAAHFLERLDRVPRSLTDFALELYRDPERVRWIIHYAHLPETEERVAFALGPGGAGPYIVLTREGHFVTALGAEMTPKNLTILSRAQVNVFSDRVKDARSRFALAKEIVPPGKAPEDVLNLLETRAWSITREELRALAAWTPILGGRFLSDMFDGLEDLDAIRRNYLTRHDKEYRNDPDVQQALLNCWNTTNAIGCRMVLSTMGDLTWTDTLAAHWPLPVGPTVPATNERVHSVTMRGAWAAARMGRGFVSLYKQILSTPGDMPIVFDAAVAMTAVGLRHARYREDARRFVAAMAETPNTWNIEFSRLIVKSADRALTDPEAATRDAYLYGAMLLITMGARLADDSPYKYTQVQDVPQHIALLVAANAMHDSLHPLTFDLLPWVAQLQNAEELFYPKEMASELAFEWTPELIEQVYERHKGGKRGPVVRQTPRVGRNEQCPCDSGKKYKRCCGR